MAWNAPSTWTSGAILTAAQLNAQLRDNMLELAPFFSAFSSWTPQVDQGATTNIAKTVNQGKYLKIGKLAILLAQVTMTAGGTAGSPVKIMSSSWSAVGTFSGQPHGGGFIYDASTTTYYNVSLQATGSDFQFIPDIATNQAWGSNPNVALASGDVIKFFTVVELT